MAESRPGRGADQFIVRFPDGFRERIKEVADKNGRSMNAEIVDLIGKALDGEAGPERAELQAIIERQNQHILDQGKAIEHLSNTIKFQNTSIEVLQEQLEKSVEFPTSILRRILDYIDEIPASLVIWADENLRILDLDSDWVENEDEEDVILRPNAPENRKKVLERVKEARARHQAYSTKAMARILRERGIKIEDD